MTAVRLMIGGRDYDVACDDGQENHLRQLGRALDQRIREIVGAPGQIPETQSLLLAALTLMDELQDTSQEREQLRYDIQHSSQSFEQNKQIELGNAVAATIHSIADRMEAIAEELERV